MDGARDLEGQCAVWLEGARRSLADADPRTENGAPQPRSAGDGWSEHRVWWAESEAYTDAGGDVDLSWLLCVRRRDVNPHEWMTFGFMLKTRDGSPFERQRVAEPSRRDRGNFDGEAEIPLRIEREPAEPEDWGSVVGRSGWCGPGGNRCGGFPMPVRLWMRPLPVARGKLGLWLYDEGYAPRGNESGDKQPQTLTRMGSRQGPSAINGLCNSQGLWLELPWLTSPGVRRFKLEVGALKNTVETMMQGL